MKILITGSTGLLGRALLRSLALPDEVIGLSRHVPAAPGAGRHVACDLLDARRTREIIRRVKPDIVIHAQALSDVDRCESDPDVAREQNVRAGANLLRALEEQHALLVAISTDYVFDGAKGAPYDEEDLPRPINVYGKSKVALEQLVLNIPRSVVVRTSTLFGPGRMTFCETVIVHLQARRPIEAFEDQVTSPTYTDDLAAALRELSFALRQAWDPRGPRLFHLVNAGGCSRVTFAARVAQCLGESGDLIHPVPLASQRRVAPRPAYTALRSVHLSRVIRTTLRPWDEALRAYLALRMADGELRKI